jgi:ribosomal protein S18 acetylase RimI-like enzyme
MTEQPIDRAPQLFAAYAPRQAGSVRASLPRDLLVRPSVVSDNDALAEIAWIRHGGDRAHYVERFARDLANHGKPRDDLWLTALVGERLVGYGKVASLDVPVDAPPNHAPAGYYLGGVTVHPDFRRRGIGHELTRRRLAWIAHRASHAFYFVNAQNRASIDLHARFGFVEVTRDFFVPGVSFTGETGVLFRADLTAQRDEAEPSPQPSPGVPGEGE